MPAKEPSPGAGVQPAPTFPMPGRPDLCPHCGATVREQVRAPLRRFPDLEGREGYLLPAGTTDEQGINVLYDFVRWPETMAGKEVSGGEITDLQHLCERNYEDNREDLRAAGQEGFRDWKELWGRHAGGTIVLASSGPSLTRSLPALYRHREKFTLLCSNRSLRAFTRPGHRPDYYYFVERRGLVDWTHEVDGAGRPGRRFDLDDVALIATPQADPRVVRAFAPARRFWGFTGLGALGQHPDVLPLTKFDIKLGTTIGNAPYLAWRLGARRIVLVGFDFAFESVVVPGEGPEGLHLRHVPARLYFDRPYASYSAASLPGWAHGPVPAFGHDGKACMVSRPCLGNADYLVAALDFLHYEAGVEIVNCTPTGVLVWNNRDLEEVLEELP